MPPKDNLPTASDAGSTTQYMSMYGKFSTDGFLRIGNECPDFSCDTTHGHLTSFHEWKRGQWALLCSHPRAFHPVGTTELGSLSQKYETLRSIGCKVIALSVDSVEDHKEWLKDVEAYNSAKGNDVKVQFPIISDGNRSISEAYSMIDPFTMGQQTLTVRSVFVVNPDNVLMLRLDYPACVGRNVDEIIRSIMALKLSYEHSIQTPANWPHNREAIPDSGGYSTQHTGAVFLLPTVSDKEARERSLEYHTVPVPSGKAYLRMVKPQSVGIMQDSDSMEFTESSDGSNHQSVVGKAGQQSKREKAKQKKGLSKWFMGFTKK